MDDLKRIYSYFGKSFPILAFWFSFKSVLELGSLFIVYFFVSGEIFEINNNIHILIILCIIWIFFTLIASNRINVYSLNLGIRTAHFFASETSYKYFESLFLSSDLITSDRQISRVCFESHRLNQNIFTPSIQILGNLATFAFITLGLVLYKGAAILFAFFILAIGGIFIAFFIAPKLKINASHQKIAHRNLLADYKNLMERGLTVYFSGNIKERLESSLQYFKKHNDSFVNIQTYSLFIKLFLEAIVYLSVILAIYIVNILDGRPQEILEIIFIIALASIRLLPAGVQISKNLSVIKSDIPLLDDFLDALKLSDEVNDINASPIKELHSKLLIMGKSGSGKSTAVKQYAKSNLNHSQIIFLEASTAIDLKFDNKPIKSLIDKNIISKMILDDEILSRKINLAKINVSRGQYQRINLAIELSSINDNSILILDEALNGCNSELEIEILLFLFNFCKSRNIKLLVVSHNDEISNIFSKDELLVI